MAAKKHDKQAERKPAGNAADQAERSARLVKKKSARRTPKKSTSLSEAVVKRGRHNTPRPSLFWFTLHFIYKNLYILGISLSRGALRFRRRMRRGALRAKGSFYALLEKFGLLLRGIGQRFLLWLRTPFQRIGDTYRKQLPAIQSEREQDKIPFSAYLPIMEAVGRFVWRILSTLFNHLAPVLAAIILVNSIQTLLTRPVALRLVYDGHEMGYIQNESVFDDATQLVRDRFIDQSDKFSTSIPTFVVEEVNVDKLLSSEDLADMLIQLSDSEIESAYGLFVGGELIGASTEKDPILDELARIRRENHTGHPDEHVEFAKKIELKEALYPANSVLDTAEIIEQLHTPAEKEEIYVVQAGDTPTEIADQQGMSYSDLLQLNPTIEEDLKPGYELKIRGEQPFLPVKNIYTDVYTEDIPFETVEIENSLYASTYRKVEQEGVDGERRVTAEITRINGVEVERTVIDDSEILKHPVNERIIVGTSTTVSGSASGSSSTPQADMTPSAQSAATSGFLWPTASGRATTYPNHSGNGIDIAPGGSGHPVYASRGGTVAKVASGVTGYGNHVIIDHGDGYSTLYAHNSANYVAVGQRVEQGQVIASLGRTGWASGPHLHFEVRYNGRSMNPVDYVGYNG